MVDKTASGRKLFFKYLRIVFCFAKELYVAAQHDISYATSIDATVHWTARLFRLTSRGCRPFYADKEPLALYPGAPNPLRNFSHWLPSEVRLNANMIDSTASNMICSSATHVVVCFGQCYCCEAAEKCRDVTTGTDQLSSFQGNVTVGLSLCHICITGSMSELTKTPVPLST